jgi:hypothetical protein
MAKKGLTAFGKVDLYSRLSYETMAGWIALLSLRVDCLIQSQEACLIIIFSRFLKLIILSTTLPESKQININPARPIIKYAPSPVCTLLLDLLKDHQRG